jgi:hypothetical protein
MALMEQNGDTPRFMPKPDEEVVRSYLFRCVVFIHFLVRVKRKELSGSEK